MSSLPRQAAKPAFQLCTSAQAPARQVGLPQLATPLASVVLVVVASNSVEEPVVEINPDTLRKLPYGHMPIAASTTKRTYICALTQMR